MKKYKKLTLIVYAIVAVFVVIVVLFTILYITTHNGLYKFILLIASYAGLSCFVISHFFIEKKMKKMDLENKQLKEEIEDLKNNANIW